MNPLLHSPSKCHPSLQLQGNILCNQLGIGLRLSYLLDVYINLFTCQVLQVLLEIFNLCALLTYDYSRSGSIYIHLALIGNPFYLYLADTGMKKLLLEEAPYLYILMKGLGITLIKIPLRIPAFINPKP